MSSNVIFGMTSNGHSGLSWLPTYRCSLMSMHVKFSASMLACHLTPSSDGHDETSEFNITLDPKKTSSLYNSVESFSFALGTSTNVFRMKVTMQI